MTLLFGFGKSSYSVITKLELIITKLFDLNFNYIVWHLLILYAILQSLDYKSDKNVLKTRLTDLVMV